MNKIDKIKKQLIFGLFILLVITSIIALYNI